MTPEQLMRRAILLSLEKMKENQGGPFGAVIAKGGEIVAEGWNRVLSSKDPTAHAEVMAIREASERLGTFDLSGMDIYASCEPCPMCMAAIYWARLDRVYYANTRSDAGAIGFDDEHLYHELAMPIRSRSLPMKRILQDEAIRVFGDWEKKEDKTPY